MMILPAAVSQAANTPITSVSITVTVPKSGETTATKPGITLPSGSHYELVGAYWISDDYIDELASNVTFEAGKVYNIGIILRAETGYTFDSPTLQATNATRANDFTGSTSGEAFIFVVKVTALPSGSEPQPSEPQPSEPTEKVTLSKLKSVKLTAVSAKKIKVTWKKLTAKQRKKIKQIQIQVSTDKNFTKIVKKKTLSSKKTSWTIPGLKKNTKYYVRIRAYTKDGNVINVSKWVTKNKKTKKN